ARRTPACEGVPLPLVGPGSFRILCISRHWASGGATWVESNTLVLAAPPRAPATMSEGGIEFAVLAVLGVDGHRRRATPPKLQRHRHARAEGEGCGEGLRK